ncbi:MAG: TonB-dependent receptor [Bacteroidota bacterium]
MKKQVVFWFLLCLASFEAKAQFPGAVGKVLDATNQQSLAGANVMLCKSADTSDFAGATTDTAGRFFFRDVEAGKYLLKITYVGYLTHREWVNIESLPHRFGKISLEPDAKLLDAVNVEETAVRVEQKGDTSVYNAGAFKVNPDATTEDLIKKMPGITVENGTIKAQGEDVKKVLIDGKTYFGDDASMAVKNIPADMVDKVQVYNKLSDQAQFTGIDDGNAEKTLNIITKAKVANGQFGKFYGGYGNDEEWNNSRYTLGATLNLFKDDRRVSILGLSNNINVQNFSTDDILGAMGMAGGGMGGRGNWAMRYGGGGASNFMVGQQNGITTTHSIGINYSDEWSKKVKFSGSYFFNYSSNSNNSTSQKTYFSNSNAGQVYDENKESYNENMNHRANFKIEYDIDSMNSVTVSSKFTFQNNFSSKTTTGTTVLSDVLLNNTSNSSSNNSTGYTLNNSFLYRHKFAKKGRTVSLNIDANLNRKNGNGKLLANNQYFNSTDTSDIINQENNSQSQNDTYSPNLEYSEPIGKHGIVQFTYNPSFTINYSEKFTYDGDDVTNQYDLMDTTLSNQFDNNYTTHKGGIAYRYDFEKVNFSIGTNYQNARLFSNQQFPYTATVDQTFANILPHANFHYNFTKTKNIKSRFRTSTNAPSISQLQNVIDNSNPLSISSGNPDLEQSYTYMLMTHYSSTNMQKGTSLFVFVMGSITDNYVGNSTLVVSGDTTINNVTLNSGSQFTQPVNLNGYKSLRSYVSYGTPMKKIKSNVNFNGGFTLTTTPGKINNDVNLADNYNLNSGLTIGSNISEKIDFTLGYTANYTIVKNSINISADNNYINHVATLKANFFISKHFVLSSDAGYNLYNGLGDAFNQQYILWNGGFAYKFMKNNAAELKLSVFDILKQNNSISRTVTETYIEDTQSQVLTRYFMLSFSWNLKKFNTEKKPEEHK